MDGDFLTDEPQNLVQQLEGSIADVPFVTGGSSYFTASLPVPMTHTAGSCDDEGTLFSVSTLNITAPNQVQFNFVGPTRNSRNIYEPTGFLTPHQLRYENSCNTILPSDTGVLNALAPQFKHIAALRGDASFQAPDGSSCRIVRETNKRLKALPFIGSYHVSDLSNVIEGQDMTSYLVCFVSNLDPNSGTDLYWPQYTTVEPNMLEFLDGSIPQALMQDTYRVEAMAFFSNLMHLPL
ncbi:hypothetical protein PAXINDRAFT_12296 [Paxillus involutus ATCC 200175]|uniref:Uncharacterized protein n=1 Tax=Paxillus involutus ATCC 200175 TaxID=664439 RepID=A0A0C9U7B7_PAXIN|nr:hypothetical protein PAXINDRAFT_12296 [Paxillus involutus ATCC 200175]